MKSTAHKTTTLRTAKAKVTVHASAKAVAACKSGKTPKGAVIDVARVAGIMAAKKTPELIPFCHPIPLDHIGIEIECKGKKIKVTASATAVAKTGVEMEALTAASVAALTIYDMLKPIDKKLQISGLKLIEKHGGKSNFIRTANRFKRAAILIPSDRASKDPKKDTTGPFICQALKQWDIETLKQKIIPNDRSKIEEVLKSWCRQGIDLIITSGGTGIGPRDKTVEATRNVINRELPGISEALRAHGYARTPYAALSNGIAGLAGKTLIINLPGSPKAVSESLEILKPVVLHAFDMIDDRTHFGVAPFRVR